MLDYWRSDSASVAPHLDEYNAALRACDIAADITRAERIFSRMENRNMSSYATMAVIYGNSGRMKDAISMATKALGGLKLTNYFDEAKAATSTADEPDATSTPSIETTPTTPTANSKPLDGAQTGALTRLQQAQLLNRLIDSALVYRFHRVAFDLLRCMREELALRPRLATFSNLLIRVANTNDPQTSFELLKDMRSPGIRAALRGVRPIELGALLPAFGCALRNRHYELGDLVWTEIQSRYLPAEKQIVFTQVPTTGRNAEEQSLFEVPDIFFYTRANLLAQQDIDETLRASATDAGNEEESAKPANESSEAKTPTEQRAEVVLSERMRTCFEVLQRLHGRRYRRMLGLQSDVDTRDTAPRLSMLRCVVNSLAAHVDRVDAAHFALEHELVQEPTPDTGTRSHSLPGKMDLLTPLNCVILASSMIGDLDRAFQTYETLQDHGKKHHLAPNIETFHALLMGCGRKSHWEAAKLVIEKIQEAQLRLTGETHEKLVYVMLRCRRFSEALDYVRGRSEQQLDGHGTSSDAPLPFTTFRLIARAALRRPEGDTILQEIQQLASRVGYGNVDLAELSLSGTGSNERFSENMRTSPPEVSSGDA
jgi:hypothetical protein